MWRPPLLAILLLTVVACHPTRDQHYRLFVSNEADNTVSVIDGATRAITAQIPVGKRPRALHVSRDGSTLYVALSGSPRDGPGVDQSKLPPPDRAADGIGVVDLKTLALVRTISSGTDPESFDLVDGTTLVVSNEDAAQASIVDVASGAVRAQVAVGREPEGVTTAPDGGLVGRIVATIATAAPARARVHARRCARPRHRRGRSLGHRDRHRDARGAHADRDPGAGQRAGRTAADGHRDPGGPLRVRDHRARWVEIGERPWGIVAAPDGMLYTANGSSSDVSMVDPDSGRVLSRIRCGASPWGIAVQHL